MPTHHDLLSAEPGLGADHEGGAAGLRQDPASAPLPHRQASPGGGAADAAHMRPRHLVMMALGSAIGTGLFVGTGSAIALAGPAVLVSFLVACVILVLVMRAMGEMAAAQPARGAFSLYAEQAMGRTAGQTLGWLWWVQLVIVIAAEATAAAQILHELWPTVPQWTMALAFMTLFTALNLISVKALGESEFWFALLKVGAVVVFLLLGAALLLGLLPVASPGLGNLTGHGGFMPNGVTGVAAALLVVVFAFGGTELVTVAAAETQDPQRNIIRAIRTIVVRLLVFYVGSVTLMVLILPWNDQGLSSSPFVAVLTEVGLPGAQAVMAVVIAVALLSALNANLYGASRMLQSLSSRGSAPRRFSRLSAQGVPRAAVLASVLFGFVTVGLNYLWPEALLGFLLNTIGSTVLVVWTLSLISQIILRRRADRAGQELPFRMWAFPYLSYLALALIGVIFLLGLSDPVVRSQLGLTAGLVAAIAVLCKVLSPRTSPAAESLG
ncbi:amino acid transporter [Kocuria dechangensis]|uniref:Amino acid transporter n=1 Tax=Kocuria dechangensis TaxID=1176249 RepID=A0A917LMZ4_9MICC|nr:amino acid permease [Kocuria dechangensis]GGG45111.1 amino acid transporter [Kocuria dechangensis]